jgi:hypothetical protein
MAEVRPAAEMADNADALLANVQDALAKIKEFSERVRSDEEFAQLWDTDSAAALRQVGIDPDARRELGYEPYDDKLRGPECMWCVTPNGNACHC